MSTHNGEPAHEAEAERQRLVDDLAATSEAEIGQQASPGPGSPNTEGEKEMTRSLTFFNGLAISIGIQIGSGIFTSPSAVLDNISSPFAAVTVWLAAGLLAWTGAASFIELGTRLPRNGGTQEYLRHCYNDTAACIGTWLLIFMVKATSMAIVSLVFAEYLFGSFGLDSSSRVWSTKALALVIMAVMTFFNCIGTRISARIANFFLVIKVLGLGSIVITGLTLGFFRHKTSPQNMPVRRDEAIWSGTARSTESESDNGPWTAIGMYTDAILAAMWSYSGWESLGYVGGEIVDAKRVIPRILNSAMAIVITLYVLANVAYLNVIPFEQSKHTDTIALIFGKNLFGHAGELYFCCVVALSCLGALDVKIFTLGRLSQAAVERKYLPSVLGSSTSDGTASAVRTKMILAIDDNQPVSIRLYVFNFALAMFYVLIGSFRGLLTFVGMADSALCCASVFGLIFLRLTANRQPDQTSSLSFKILFNATTFCLASGFVVLRSGLRHWIQGLLLVAFVGIGILVIKLRRQNRD